MGSYLYQIPDSESYRLYVLGLYRQRKEGALRVLGEGLGEYDNDDILRAYSPDYRRGYERSRGYFSTR